jgi:hypothetical protein
MTAGFASMRRPDVDGNLRSVTFIALRCLRRSCLAQNAEKTVVRFLAEPSSRSPSEGGRDEQILSLYPVGEIAQNLPNQESRRYFWLLSAVSANGGLAIVGVNRIRMHAG